MINCENPAPGAHLAVRSRNELHTGFVLLELECIQILQSGRDKRTVAHMNWAMQTFCIDRTRNSSRSPRLATAQTYQLELCVCSCPWVLEDFWEIARVWVLGGSWGGNRQAFLQGARTTMRATVPVFFPERFLHHEHVSLGSMFCEHVLFHGFCRDFQRNSVVLTRNVKKSSDFVTGRSEDTHVFKPHGNHTWTCAQGRRSKVFPDCQFSTRIKNVVEKLTWFSFSARLGSKDKLVPTDDWFVPENIDILLKQLGTTQLTWHDRVSEVSQIITELQGTPDGNTVSRVTKKEKACVIPILTTTTCADLTKSCSSIPCKIGLCWKTQ